MSRFESPCSCLVCKRTAQASTLASTTQLSVELALNFHRMWCNRWHQIGRSIVGAVALAVKAVNDDPMLLPGRKLQYVLRDSDCTASVGSSNAACEATAVLTNGADIPQISPMCDSSLLSDKQLYPTVCLLPRPPSMRLRDCSDCTGVIPYPSFTLQAGIHPITTTL